MNTEYIKDNNQTLIAKVDDYYKCSAPKTVINLKNEINKIITCDDTFAGDEYVKKGLECFNQKDYDNAFQNFSLAEEKNNPIALNAIGYCYNFGYCVIKDTLKTYEYFKKSAQLGYLMAINNLGLFYCENDKFFKEELGIYKVKNIGLNYLTFSAEHGYLSSKYNIGYEYQHFEDGYIDYLSKIGK